MCGAVSYTHLDVYKRQRDSCPPVTLDNCQLPQKEDVKYLGIYLDRRLTWRKHIITKNKQLRLQYRQMSISYTHLDVYKRQLLGFILGIIK